MVEIAIRERADTLDGYEHGVPYRKFETHPGTTYPTELITPFRLKPTPLDMRARAQNRSARDTLPQSETIGDDETPVVIARPTVPGDQDGIKEPLGMSGVRLEAKVHIVTAAVSSAQNIIKCANRTGLNVADICLEQLASSEAVLSQDEKDIGVVLVDIGGGTSDLVIYHNGSIAHTAVLSLGGDHLTNDIAVGLRTPRNEAEIIKRKFGCAPCSNISTACAIEPAWVISPALTKNISSAFSIVFNR
jgi:hypothetical protein